MTVLALGDYPPTPRLTYHARQRCAEMDVRTKRVKRIVRDPHLVYASYAGARVMTRDDDPDIAAVVAADELVVVTVVWRTTEQYIRNGTTYIALEKSA